MKEQHTIELTEKEMQTLSGGDFAYDFGFFLREVFISVVNGGGVGGGAAAIKDIGENYRPIN